MAKLVLVILAKHSFIVPGAHLPGRAEGHEVPLRVHYLGLRAVHYAAHGRGLQLGRVVGVAEEGHGARLGRAVGDLGRGPRGFSAVLKPIPLCSLS